MIARNTAFTFKGKTVDAKEIAKELGVRYVLEGSVQRDQSRVRVNAQLVDAQSGAHLWADRFDEDVADLFKLQDQVVARLASTVGFELVKAEAERGARSRNPDAIDLVMRGWAARHQWESQTKDNDLNKAARAFFERALEIDPNNVEALAGDAETYLVEFVYGPNPETDYDAKILGQNNRAIALASDSTYAYTVKSQYLTNSNRPDEALRAADTGLANNPNAPYLYASRGLAEVFLGRYADAKTDEQRAFQLSRAIRIWACGTISWVMQNLALGIWTRWSTKA